MHAYSIRPVLSLLAMLAFTLVLTGCEKKPPEPPPPPPPTPQEIADGIMSDLQMNQPLPAPRSALPPGVGASFLNAVKAAKRKHSASPDGIEALQIVSGKVSQRLLALEKRKMWEHVLIYCAAHVILNPKSIRFKRTQERATIEFKKPRVTIDGFFYDGKSDRTSVFMRFYLPIEKVEYREKVRVGEEFYGLKMVAIVGKNKGVTMEYLETGETSDILFNATAQ